MRHCGIDLWASNETPFGARAIQTGVEVEGIWIARSVTPDTSQVASSATLMGDHNDLPISKGKQPDHNMDGTRHHRFISEGFRINPVSEGEPITALTPESWKLGHHRRLASNLRMLASPKPPPEQASDEVWSYQPSGFCNTSTPDEASCAPPSIKRPNPVRDSFIKSRHTQDVDSAPEAPPQLYGQARIHANRTARTVNPNFEILPAGSLGPRRELLSDPDLSLRRDGKRLPHFQPGPAKLRKKHPVRGGNSI